MTDVSSKNDELGGIKPKIPAWKLRQQQRANYKPTTTNTTRNNNNNNNNDGLGGTKAIRQRSNNDELGVTKSSADISTSRRRSNDDELGSTSSPSIHNMNGVGAPARVPAWKLREQMKQRDHNFNDKSSHSSTSTGSSSMGSLQSSNTNPASSNHSNHPSRSFRPVSRVPGAVDPLLPPAFRPSVQKPLDRKKTGDDVLSMSSVHSRTTAWSRTNSYGSDSFGSLGDDSDSDGTDSFDGEDSFASLDSDADEDDEAYRESRNQMARLEIEKQKQAQVAKRGGIRGRSSESRFKKKSLGVHGTPLGFIAE
jgi:hypothetical protein